MWETQVRSLGWEDPLEKEMATHSSIIAWKIPRTEDPGGPHSMGSQRVEHDWATNTHEQKESKWLKMDELKFSGRAFKCLFQNSCGSGPDVASFLWVISISGSI